MLASASSKDVGAVRLDDDGNLVIPPLSAEDIPAEARALKEELAGMLPFAPVASLLIELLSAARSARALSVLTKEPGGEGGGRDVEFRVPGGHSPGRGCSGLGAGSAGGVPG